MTFDPTNLLDLLWSEADSESKAETNGLETSQWVQRI